MIEQILPAVYVGIAGLIGVMGFRGYMRYRTEQIKLAKQQQLDLSKPEAAIDNLVGLIQAAPQLYQAAQQEMADIKKNNQGKNIDLTAQEQQLKWLSYAVKYQKPLMVIAPIAGPILKKYVKGMVRGL